MRTAAVRLVGLSHSRPSDLDMWLVAPDGTAVTLLSDAGGEEVEGVELTIFGRAGAAEPDAAFGPATGPTDLEADEQWSGRRPAADLALLTGIDPNGQWELLVADDERGAVGSLESWVLILELTRARPGRGPVSAEVGLDLGDQGAGGGAEPRGGVRRRQGGEVVGGVGGVAAGVVERVADGGRVGPDEVAGRQALGVVERAAQQRPSSSPLGAGEGPQHGQGVDALDQVVAGRLAELLVGGDHVEDVVDDLEGHAVGRGRRR